jgi:hypothetical protein
MEIKNKMNKLLYIELVPQTCWFSNVRNHVTKPEWDIIRKSVFAKAGNRCEICGGKGAKWPVECHEIFAYDDALKFQTLVGMIALCPACHQAKHFGLARLKGVDKEAMWHLCEVNNWTIDQGVDHVNQQMTIGIERSKHEWSVDLQFLKNTFGITIKEEGSENRAKHGEGYGVGFRSRP